MEVVLITISILVVIISLLLCCLANGTGPIRLFKSCVSRKEFKLMTSVIFSVPNVHVGRDEVQTNDYRVRNCTASSVQSFSINEIEDFSFAQKIHFLRQRNKWLLKKNGNPRDNRRKKLNLHKLTPAGQVLYKDAK